MARFPWESVSIRGVERGIIVQVGCKELVFTDKEKDVFMDDLGKLLFGGREVSEALQKKYFPEEFGWVQTGRPVERHPEPPRPFRHQTCCRCGRPIGRTLTKYDDTNYCECDTVPVEQTEAQY